ncbi:MAG: transglutaminase family protein [Bifidobacteriaceae bacterium]|jgi:transglutaminase-like putative cysteine protease|nr:transglutaminase family protein [Bifidobacteriaceae bacterium]
MKRLRVRHEARFTYQGNANASYNEARMLPRDCSGQQVLSASLTITPHGPQFPYRDYWGTPVVGFEVLIPHSELCVVADSLVEVNRPLRLATRASWVEMRHEAEARSRLLEHITQTPRTEPTEEVFELARDLAASPRDPFDTAQAICEAIRDRIDYVPGVTGVGSTAKEAWAKGKGVCQDITHIALGALRSVGIPARYVSGYLHPDEMPQVGVTAQAESHAWLEWHSGSWMGFDPTNRIPVGDRHVLVARGRDYDDIAPVKGVYSGAVATELWVDVRITRES